MKCLQVTKIVKEMNFEGVWDKLEAKNISRDNHLQNIWAWLCLSCEINHYGKSLTLFFEELLAAIKNILILAGRLDTSLSFYEV